MANRHDIDSVHQPPFDTHGLRQELKRFLDAKFDDPVAGLSRRVGSFKCGVYAFFDYDGEPIYVGQTRESISSRIGRHLTNQRTDAVAMSVLDPFEVFEIEVWPLPELQSNSDQPDAKAHLDALEHLIYQQAVDQSRFKVVLNEKDPPPPTMDVQRPPSYRGRIVSDEVYKVRSHPDFRIARRALVISRLAQVISERKVKPDLRRVLVAQSKRLEWLAERRYEALTNDAIPQN